MVNYLFKILKDEKGLIPWVPAAIAAGGAILGAAGGGGEEKVFDPFAGLRADFGDKLQKRLGTSTKFEDVAGLKTTKPGVESAAEKAILGGIQEAPQKREDIFDISQKYYNARKSQLETRQQEEQADLKNIYNKLGIVSSTPGLEAQADLMRKQSEEFNVLESEVAKQGIDQELKAEALASDILNQFISQGQVLGQTQRGAEQFEKTASIQDISRRTGEEFDFFNLANSILGQTPVEREFEPDFLSRIGQISAKALPGAMRVLGTS